MAFQRCYKAGGGNIPSFYWNIASPIYTQYKKNDTATSTYTASESCRVLVFNSEVIDEAGSGHSTEANITTTGTVIKTVLNQTTFDGDRKIRDSETRLSLIDLEANDTVTISNSSRTTYINKTHIIWEADGIEDISESSYYDAIVDSNRDTTKLYGISNGTYLLLSQEVCGADVGCTASITGPGILSGYSNIATNNSIAVAVASGTSIETLSTGNVSNYVSTIYGAWRITGTGQMPNITPSNSNPAELTANTPVNPLANGYAIESYSKIGLFNTTPHTLNSGEVYLVRNSGVAVGTMDDITPSNDSPIALSQIGVYRALASGYAIKNYGSITPSDSIPASISKDAIYRATANGYAISSYLSKIPSDSSPASISSGAIIKAMAAGYLYSSMQPKVKKGTFTTSGSSVTEFTVNVGFQPDTVIVFFNGSSGSMTGSSAANGSVRYIYDKNTNASYGFRSYRTTSSSAFCDMAAVEATGDTRISAITSTGFKWRNGADTKWNGTHTYIAIQW